jgi:hypothetical protein
LAQDRYFLAITLSLVTVFALRVLLPFKQKLDARAAEREGHTEPK